VLAACVARVWSIPCDRLLLVKADATDWSLADEAVVIAVGIAVGIAFSVGSPGVSVVFGATVAQTGANEGLESEGEGG
jgi:hypothetical protein